MIDLDRLNATSLRARPIVQRILARAFVGPTLSRPGRPTRLVVEGEEHLPRGGGAILVMNHTDRYNYWPFQYWLWRHRGEFTTTWVKGKYYENRFLAWFMDVANNIPLPSRGYVITKDFQRAMGRLPSDEEYAALKRLGDGLLDEKGAGAQGGAQVAELLSRHHPGAPSGRYADSLEARFAGMMQRVVALCAEAFEKNLYLLIFPQGTRSVHLTPGHPGAAQIALHMRAPVIPIGCSGSDRLYPGNSPVSRGGTVTYRIGAPLTVDGELARFRIDEPFTPFTRGAERFAPIFEEATRLFMGRINDLVDPPYRFGEDDGDERGAKRFV